MVKNSNQINFLNEKSQKIRLDFLKLIYKGFKYHIGGSLSCADILVNIFYTKKVKKSKDFFLLSKGHALGILYAIMLDKKKFNFKFLEKLRKNNKIGGQLDTQNIKINDWNTGSLGHTVGISIGLSLAKPYSKIFNIIGDAEIDEGSVWEGLMYISEKKIKNIIIIIDRNNQSASSFIKKKEVFDKDFLKLLNLNYFKINGHSHKSISQAISKSLISKRSSIIIANTTKGYGFKEFEKNLKYSHESPDKKFLNKIIGKYEKKTGY
jgi:transketolase